jgi:hypothetical protein
MTPDQQKIDDLTHALAKSNLQLLLAHELLGKIAERDLSLIGSTSIMRMEISNYFQDFKRYKKQTNNYEQNN